MSAMHLIQFRTKKEHQRAIMTLLEVPRAESLGLPNYQMVVTDEHLHALENAKVPFTFLSQPSTNGKTKTPSQS